MLALLRNGMVLSWGVGMVGQLGRVGLRMASPEATQLTPAPVPFLKRRPPPSCFVDIAAGSYSSFSVDDKGHVFAWGLNNYHQLGLPGKVWGLSFVQCPVRPGDGMLLYGHLHTKLACRSIMCVGQCQPSTC